ncbi:endonuclease/exonuclease/phosphatase family protein [Streptomyces sp. NPDC088915]|uniref:endonuclease/exonuclease/phosphatase family protein n=1 Tax=Streptomyces sp. NPDC088915 TaxID=3365912 RepID=UPI003830590D
MKSFKALATTLGAAAALLFTTLAAPTPAAADTVPANTPQALRFVTYNMCGNMCKEGTGPTGYDNAHRIESIVAEAGASGWKADQIFLQEVCQDQYTELSTKLAPLGFNGRFAGALTGQSGACGGDPYGVALFVKGAIVQTKTLDLSQGTESEPILVPCVKSYLQGRLNWACTVHLYWADNPVRDVEAAELRWQAEAWEKTGTPVVLGGDFNGFPNEAFMDGYYGPAVGSGAKGVFTEADQSDPALETDKGNDPACASGAVPCQGGESTFRSKGDDLADPADDYDCKIDYLFFSSRHFKDVVGDSLPLDTEASDHHLVRGAANWAS